MINIIFFPVQHLSYLARVSVKIKSMKYLYCTLGISEHTKRNPSSAIHAEPFVMQEGRNQT